MSGFWEYDDFLRFNTEVHQMQFVEDTNIVVSCLELCVTTYNYVILYLGDDSLFHLFLENFGHQLVQFLTLPY